MAHNDQQLQQNTLFHLWSGSLQAKAIQGVEKKLPEGSTRPEKRFILKLHFHSWPDFSRM
jgi:hypothetical protein